MKIWFEVDRYDDEMYHLYYFREGNKMLAASMMIDCIADMFDISYKDMGKLRGAVEIPIKIIMLEDFNV